MLGEGLYALSSRCYLACTRDLAPAEVSLAQEPPAFGAVQRPTSEAVSKKGKGNYIIDRLSDVSKL